MNLFNPKSIAIALFSFTVGISHAADSVESASTIIPVEDIEWGYLNPLRGDKSPGAANLWGDRTKDEATGMLVKFNEGFSSPPHVHNITYRGVVINGLLHNADKNARNMWMPTGSFWTQPAGESHITAANGKANLAYIEIDSGPYLVKPTSEAFDNGEKPVNVHQSNIVWLDAADIAWVSHDKASDTANSPKIAALWQEPSNNMSGTLIKLPANFSGAIRSKGDKFHAVVISGQVKYGAENDSKLLAAGSYFGAQSSHQHTISSSELSETIIYVRADARFEIVYK